MNVIQGCRNAGRLACVFALCSCGGAAPSADAASARLAREVASAPAATTGDTTPASEVRADLARFFAEEGVEGTFVLYDAKANRVLRYNPERAGRRFRPASTFKIPNTLIAAENGVVDGPEFLIRWDSVRDPRIPRRDAWFRDHTLRSAFRESAVWYYREVARRIGEPRMKAALAKIGYGNQDVSDGIDQFWLRGSLQVSAEEQVAFLRRLYRGELGFSERATGIVKEVMRLEEGDGWRWSGKTGAYPTGEGDRLMTWHVGWVERGSDVYVYATNAEGPDDAVFPTRASRARAILAHLGLLPAAD